MNPSRKIDRHRYGKVSIPKRVSEALNPPTTDLLTFKLKTNVSIPKRVSEALNLSRPSQEISRPVRFQSLKGFQRL